MESNFNNKDFEQFLKQNADQYRMFPSENVWKGIDNALHTRRRWYGLGLALLLLLTGAGVTWVMISTPANKIEQSLSDVVSSQQPAAQPEKAGSSSVNSPAPVLNEPLMLNKTRNSPEIDQVQAPATVPSIVVNQEPFLISHSIADRENITSSTSFTAEQAAHDNFYPTHLKSAVLPFALAIGDRAGQLDIAAIETPEDKTENKEASQHVASQKEIYPLSIESVINSYKRPASKKKLFWQFYLSPTVSYRKLSENKAFLRSAVTNGNVPAFVAYSDVKNVVTHKPDIGVEAGVAAKYSLGKMLRVKAGLQFNMSRYDIRAVAIQREVATIALDDGGNGSLRRLATYRNLNGTRANWLQNFYYSAAIPVGAEIKIAGKKADRYFGLAATFQPTYIVSDRAYMLSTDYKNYLEIPSLIRRWNINTGFEVFVGYTRGGTQWQIGPQVRYQVKSSFVDQYPVNENLFDFGLKVGVSFNNK